MTRGYAGRRSLLKAGLAAPIAFQAAPALAARGDDAIFAAERLFADVKAYAEAGYTGYIRPDHGRHLWNENTTNKPRPGYGLYDRALGIQYLLGVWDAINYRR